MLIKILSSKWQSKIQFVQKTVLKQWINRYSDGVLKTVRSKI